MEIKKIINPFYLYQKRSEIIPYLKWKIAIKLLLIPGVKRLFEKIALLYEIVQVKKERDMFNGKQEVYMMNFRHYLPDTEERIERLRRVINKRPVAIILHGPSVKELEKRITELEDCDICYFGLNLFRVPEKNILQKISRNFSVVMCSNSYQLIRQRNNVIDFLERQEDNIFIATKDSFRPRKMSQEFGLDKFIKKYDKKLLFHATPPATFISIRGGIFLQFPSMEYPLHFPMQGSISVLLSLAVIGEAPMVVVFGGDGGRISKSELHYRESGQYAPESVLERNLMVDAIVFNTTMPLIIEKINKLYNLRPIDIVNCSEQSHYTPFRKLSYDETFALLKSFKKDTS